MFGLFKKKSILSQEDNKRIVAAITSTEQLTSGEIRVYIESKNPLMNTLERAKEIFFKMQMHQTKKRNGVLLYVAVKDREVAIFGDEGIHQQVGAEFWNHQVVQMITHFKNNNLTDGLIQCIATVGNTLVEKFPYDSTDDKNELPDDIIFGK